MYSGPAVLDGSFLSLPPTRTRIYGRRSRNNACYANELLFRRCYYLFSLRYPLLEKESEGKSEREKGRKQTLKTENKGGGGRKEDEYKKNMGQLDRAIRVVVTRLAIIKRERKR